MKNLFEISQREKNRILEMHYRASSKQYLMEDDRPEPVKVDSYTETFFFKPGSDYIEPARKENAIITLAAYISRSVPTIVKFMGNKPNLPTAGFTDTSVNMPRVIYVYVGTDPTGDPAVNQAVGQKRLNVLNDIIKQALKKAAYVNEYQQRFVISPEIQGQLLPDQTYKPTSLDRNKFAGKEGIDSERIGMIRVDVFETMGLESDDLDDVENKMRSGTGWKFLGMGNYNPKQIVDALRTLENYSDIKDLNKKLSDKGGLEVFINTEIAGNDDSDYWLPQVSKTLNEKGQINGPKDIARIVNGVLILNLSN